MPQHRHATQGSVDRALAPFNRRPNDDHRPDDRWLIFRDHCVGSLRYTTPALTAEAQAKLCKFVGPLSEDQLEYIEDELRWPFLEALHFGRRWTHRQLIKVLKVLARLNPAADPPYLPPNLLLAFDSGQRRLHTRAARADAAGLWMQFDFRVDKADPNATAKISKMAKELLLHVRKLPPSRWDPLAKRNSWNALVATTVDVAIRIWLHLGHRLEPRKPLENFVDVLLTIVAPKYVDRVDYFRRRDSLRKQIATTLARHTRTSSKMDAA